MTDEYVERKVRIYPPKAVKQESKLSKYFVRPITKAMGVGKKDDSTKKGRLTA